MPYADPVRQRAYVREWMARRRAADPAFREAHAEQMKARWHTDPEHRARQLAGMAERRRRRRLIREAVARIPLVRAARRPAAPIVRPGGWQIADPAAWCTAGLYNDGDVTAVLHAEDPGYARGDLWTRAAA